MSKIKGIYFHALVNRSRRNVFAVFLVAVSILTVGLVFSQTALPSVRAIPLNNNPDCISWGPSRIDCFDLGSDGVPYHTYWDGPGTDWSSWLSIGGVLAATPSCVTWAVDRIDCVGVAGNSVAYHVSWDGNAWSSWAPLTGPNPPQFTSTPSCVPIAIYQQNFACVGLDTQYAQPLPRVWETIDQYWAAMVTSGDIGSIVFMSGPNCMSWGQPGRFDCFLLDSSGVPYHSWFENNVNSNDFESMGDLGVPLSFAPTCVSLGSGGFDCVGVGKDGGTYHNHWNGKVWGGWGLMAQGQLRYAPSCTTWGTNRIDCIGIGTDDQAYHIWSADGYGSTWSSWDLVAQGRLLFTPSCVAWATNRIDCVGVGTDDIAYHLSWDGSSWSSWDPIGGPGAATTAYTILTGKQITSSQTFLTGPQIVQTLTTNVAVSGTGSVDPNCPSGCSQTVGTATYVAASPAANFQFSGWSISGTSCAGGSASNPCAFTMPSNAVTVTAIFNPIGGTTSSTTAGGATSPPAITTGIIYPTQTQVQTSVPGTTQASQSSSANQQATLTQTQTVTHAASSSQTSPFASSQQTQLASQPDFLGILQQNGPLVMAAGVLILVLAVMVLRRRGSRQNKQTSVPPANVASKPGAASLFCGQCGTSNPSANQFCRKCGKKLDPA